MQRNAPFSVQITFDENETQLYGIMQAHCAKEGITVPEYIKRVIKRDLAWGHLARRTKKRKKRGDPL